MRKKRRRHVPQTRTLTKDAPWTLVGPGSVIHGELLMSGNVLIHGRVEGTIFTNGEVLVAEGGAVEGGIHAYRVVVEGSCEGRVEATEEVVLRDGALMRGDIEAKIFTHEAGARFVGGWLGGETPTPKVLPYQDGSPGRA